MDTNLTDQNRSQPGLKRVLVVDDNRPSAMTLSWAMQLHGYEVMTCFDGRSAVDAAHDFHPDVVLLDLGMPLMDGYEVCRRLRSDASLGEVTVVAQTGWGHDEVRQRTADAGFNHHLTKPLDIDALVQLIDSSVH
ncbi:MAG: response regulator [Asticcacaulis sp.]